MAIKIKALERVAKTYTDNGYLYKDLALDIQQTSLVAPGFVNPTPGTDIKTSYDIAAIRNSLQNLFNTLPGQRFLFPEYGLDLYQYLFAPITQSTGRAIGERMLGGINRYETRVSVQNINVVADPDNYQYTITLVLQIPSLNTSTSLQGTLNTKSQSFIFVPTSRTR